MRNLVLGLALFSCIGWAQADQTNVAVSTPTANSVKLTGAPPTWPQFVFPPLIGASMALAGVWLTNRNNRTANERQRQHEMVRWRAEKKQEVLSRIGQLLVQTNHALHHTEWRLKKATQLRNAQARAEEISIADESSGRARQELYERLDELATVAGGAGFALSDPLWRRLQALHQAFTDATQRERNAATSREAQLDGLKTQMDKFLALARNELDALSGRS